MGCRTCSGSSDCENDNADVDELHTLKIVLIVVVIVIVLAVGAAGMYFYLRYKRAAKTPLRSAPAPSTAPPTSVGASSSGGPSSKGGTGHSSALTVVVPKPVDVATPKLPPYWTTKEGLHVVPDPSMMGEVQKLLTESWKVKYTRDRKLADGSGVVPSGCRVVNVLRVEHHATFEKLAKHKMAVRARRSGHVKDFVATTSGKLNKLDKDINEIYLFHGTSPQAADSIARSDFRISKAGSSTGTMFGPGLYLAENSSKSDEYAKEGDGVFVGQYAMLICRAVAGRVLTVTEPGDYSGKVQSQEYDSVCGDRLSAVGTFREMVFFSEEAVYAEYIAIYVREYE